MGQPSRASRYDPRVIRAVLPVRQRYNLAARAHTTLASRESTIAFLNAKTE